MSPDRQRLGQRLAELGAQFLAGAPGQVAELVELTQRAARSQGVQREHLLRESNALAHMLCGRAAIFEQAALSEHAARLERRISAALAGEPTSSALLELLCRDLLATLPAISDTRSGIRG